MRKRIALLLCAALLLTLSGCSADTPMVEKQFFYRRSGIDHASADGVIGSEGRDISAYSDTGAILQAYLSGPESQELESPFPRDSRVLSWELRNDTLHLTMNEAFCALTGIELTIACTCILRTMTGICPVTSIQFQAEDGLLGDEKVLTFSEGSVSLYDDSLDQSRSEFTVYYTDRQRRYLLAEEISVNLATENDLVRHLVEAMMTPPENSSLLSALPSGTELLDYSINDGLCTLNFSLDFERSGWARCEAQRLTLLSIVNTLTQLEGIQQVEFCTEGDLLVQYRHLTISAPFVRDESAIGPVRTGMSEFDATLYLANGPELYLAAVPTPLRQTSGISQPELVVTALLEYAPLNGFQSTIPENTVLNGVELRNGICTIDLSSEFLSTQDHLPISVRSIVASVCALEGVYSAQITVDGQTPDGDIAPLFAVLSPQPDWFL